MTKIVRFSYECDIWCADTCYDIERIYSVNIVNIGMASGGGGVGFLPKVSL